MVTKTQVAEALVAFGFGLTTFSLALPDSMPGSPQLITIRLGAALVVAGVYLGARKPEP